MAAGYGRPVSDGLAVAFDLLVAATVITTAIAIGLEMTAASIRASLRRRGVFLAVVTINTAGVPLAAFVVIDVLPVATEPATAMLLCAICSAGPLGLKAAQLAKGDLSWAVSLVVVLTVLNVLAVPFWSSVLTPRSISVRPIDLLGMLILLIVVPVGVGALVRQRSPQRSAALLPRFSALSHASLAVAITVALVTYIDELVSTLTSWTPVAAVAVLATAAVGGAATPGVPIATRSVSALVTTNRATGVALLVVVRFFPGQAGMTTAVIVFGLLQTVAVMMSALILRPRLLNPRMLD